MTMTRVARARAWDRAQVAAFDKGTEDILVVQRPEASWVAEAMATARTHSCRSVVTRRSAADRAVEALTALNIDLPEFADDIVSLSREFLTQFRIKEAGLRVEVVDTQPCPKFHCDNVRVRMVTTFQGPTTEYIHTDAPNEVRTAPAFSLVFLKGRKHRTHADRVHHRSPQMLPGVRRLCVVLDC